MVSFKTYCATLVGIRKGTITMDNRMYNKEEIVSFLKETILKAKSLEISSGSFEAKVKMLEELLWKVETRLFPVMSKEDGWHYCVQATSAAIYCNLCLNQEYAKKIYKIEKKIPAFKMVIVKTPLVSISDFAILKGCSEASVRQDLRQGIYPYAQKTGVSWQLPVTSTPIRDEYLTGTFHFFEKEEEVFVVSDGTKIVLSEGDVISIRPIGRNEKNEKQFSVEIESHSLNDYSVNDKHTYVLGVKDKAALVFSIIKSHSQYWSADFGLWEWLMSS